MGLASSLTIRPAEDRDLSDVANLYLSVRKVTYVWESNENLAIDDFKESTKGEKVYVAVTDDKIVGFISIWEPDSFIHFLFVYPEYQGKGVGTALLNKAVTTFPEPLTLKAVTFNVKACGFYESQGWTLVSTHTDAVPPYHLYKFSRNS